MTLARRRAALAAFLDCIVVRRTPRRGATVQERALVLRRGQAPRELPGRGRLVPLRSFPWPNESEIAAVALPEVLAED